MSSVNEWMAGILEDVTEEIRDGTPTERKDQALTSTLACVTCYACCDMNCTINETLGILETVANMILARCEQEMT